MSGIVTTIQRLASAWVVLRGSYGDVSHLARVRGQERQTLYREAQAVVAAVDGAQTRAEVAQLRQSLVEATAQLEGLKQRLDRAVQITPEVQAEYASTAQALGVSLPVAHTLLAVFLKEQTPSVATLGRQTQAAAERAGALLVVLDEHLAPRVEQAAADEIFLDGERA
jgi:outer membrane protein TolC